MKYFSRVSAAIYLIGWLVWATSRIGEPISNKTLDWLGAWSFFLVIFMAAWFGWDACKESEELK